MDRMGQPCSGTDCQGCLILVNIAVRADEDEGDVHPELNCDAIVRRSERSATAKNGSICLLDFAKALPPLPERLAAHKDASHRVEECQSPVYLFVEFNGDRVALYADAPIEAPTVRGFVSLLLEGLNGATVDEVLQVPGNLVERSGLGEILGMLRVRGLTGYFAGSRPR